VGELYFISKNSGLQNQFVINVRKGLDGEDQVFIDPNAIDPAGTTTFSLMGGDQKDRYMAVGVQKAGSDWQDITVYDLGTMKQLPDVLKWAKFSGVAWYKDGFFYSRYPEPAKGTELSAASKFQKVYYHKLGDATGEGRAGLGEQGERRPVRGRRGHRRGGIRHPVRELRYRWLRDVLP
jgi:prolyl oligopeptidase